MTFPTNTFLLTGVCGLLLCGPASAQFSIGSTNYPTGTQPSGAAAGDFDGDGDVDLATTVDGPERIAVLLNDGTGVYSAGASSLLPNSSSPQDLVTGDLDGDGDADLAVAVRDPQGSVLIMLNGGGGTFTMSGSFAVGDRPRGLSIGDIDGDGDMDLAVANRNDGTASVLTNNGSGSFSVQTVSSGGETRDTAFGDFNGDGALDLAVSDHDNREIDTFANGGGTFSPSMSLSVGPIVRPDGVEAADLDNDGDTDIVTATSDPALNQATIFTKTPGGFSGPAGYPTGGQNTSGIKIADMDCDGLLDVITSNQDSNNVSFMRNTGGAVFALDSIMAAGTGPEELTTSDFDGDGDADVAVANRDSNDISVFINDTCTPPPACPSDTNGDGFVNVVDLVAVILAWDSPGGSADVNTDGIVNVLDLVQVILDWGGCP